MTPTLDIKLRGKEYRVACAPEDRESLRAAVSLLDAKMTEIAEMTRSTGERLAVMTALNIAHELLTARLGGTAAGRSGTASVDSEGLVRRIADIESRLDRVLADGDRQT